MNSAFGVGRIRWGWFIVAALVLLVLPAFTGTNTPTLLLIWALFALSLGLLWGFAGVLSFGHAAYFGLGAYSYAIAAMNVGESTGPLLLAIVLPAAVAAVIGEIAMLALAIVLLRLMPQGITGRFFKNST